VSGSPILIIGIGDENLEFRIGKKKEGNFRGLEIYGDRRRISLK
jgi:hypothetical protein